MRRSSPLRALSILLATALAGPGLVAAGDDPARPPAAVELFDGRTLDGWKPAGGTGAGSVGVKDGAIALGAGNPITAVTSTRASLPTKDYVLTFEARRTAGNDFFAAATFPVRDSFVTLVGGGWGGSVTGLSMIDGASASENVTNHFVKYQNGTWYAFEVAVTGRAIRCRVDGADVFAFDAEDAQITTRLEMRSQRPLGFASYRSAGEVRNVRIRPLAPAEVVEVDAKARRD